jgi:hypothetical protein
VIYIKNYGFYGISCNSSRYSPPLQSWSACYTKLKKNGFFLHFFFIRINYNNLSFYVIVGLTQSRVSKADVIGSNPIPNNVIIVVI